MGGTLAHTRVPLLGQRWSAAAARAVPYEGVRGARRERDVPCMNVVRVSMEEEAIIVDGPEGPRRANKGPKGEHNQRKKNKKKTHPPLSTCSVFFLDVQTTWRPS